MLTYSEDSDPSFSQPVPANIPLLHDAYDATSPLLPKAIAYILFESHNGRGLLEEQQTSVFIPVGSPGNPLTREGNSRSDDPTNKSEVSIHQV